MNKTAQIMMLPISDLKLADYNPRKKLNPHHREYRELRKSIEELGFAESIVVNTSVFLLRGNSAIQNCRVRLLT